jgi:hypothetical protein
MGRILAQSLGDFFSATPRAFESARRVIVVDWSLAGAHQLPQTLLGLDAFHGQPEGPQVCLAPVDGAERSRLGSQGTRLL